VSLGSDEVLFEEGAEGDSLFVVVHGKVAVRRGDVDVAVLGAGEVVGEMAILDEAPRSASAVAVEDADLLRVSADDFREALEDSAALAEGVINVLSRRLRDVMDGQQTVTDEETGRKTIP
jgi:CRP-like cAMP-binding protein